MISSQQFLNLMVEGCTGVQNSELARASVPGKNEALFRDLTQNALTRARPDWLVTTEWVTPQPALDRWSTTWPTGDRSKGKLDLTAVLRQTPFSPIPELAAEFKFWYWYDALDKTKYRGKPSSYNNYISQSFRMDALKLCAVAPDERASRLIATVVPTFHLESATKESQASTLTFLESRGVKYTGNVSRSLREYPGSSLAMRLPALEKIVAYFNDQGCPSRVGGGIVGTFQDITVTTDFVVTEIPLGFK
jgi:hypothetical protein